MNISLNTSAGPGTARDSGYPSQHSRPSGSDYYISGFNPPRVRDGPDQPVEYTWRPSFARRYSTGVGSALPGDSQDPSQKPSDLRVIFQEPSPRQEKKSLLFFQGVCFFIAGVTTYNWFYIVLAAGSDWIGVASGEPLSGYDGHFAEATGHSFAPLCHERATSLVLLTYMLPVFGGKLVAMMMLGTPIALRIVSIALIGLVGGTLIGWVSSLIPSIIGLLLVGFYGGFCEATFISLSSTFLKSATAWFTTGMGVISVVNAVLYAVFHDYIHRPLLFLRVNAVFPAVMALTFYLLSRNPPPSSNQIPRPGFDFKARMADLGKHYKHYLSLTLLFALSFVIHQGLFQVLAYTQLGVLSAHQQYHVFDAVFFIGYSIAMLSVKIFRFTLTWLLVVLQGVNLIILTTDSIFHFVSSVWIIIFFIFYTGVLFGGGLVGAIYEQYKKADPIAREFGLAALCAWTEIGVLAGAIVGVLLHNAICASVTAS